MQDSHRVPGQQNISMINLPPPTKLRAGQWLKVPHTLLSQCPSPEAALLSWCPWATLIPTEVSTGRNEDAPSSLTCRGHL